MDDPTRRTKKVAQRPPTVVKKQKSPARPAKAKRRDFSQIALAAVEKATDGKLKPPAH